MIRTRLIDLDLICWRRFFSYKHKGGSQPLMYKTVNQILEDVAGRYGEKTALVSHYQNARISFREVNEKAEAIAMGCLELGLVPGDRVGLWSKNSIEWYLLSFALAKAGIISVYLNPSYEATEMKHCINAVGMKMLFAATSFKNLEYSEILNQIDPNLLKGEPGKLKSSILPELKTVLWITDSDKPDRPSFRRLYEKASNSSVKKLKELQQSFNPDDASNIQFTSGTTGSPKGAVLSNFNIVNNSFFISKRLELDKKDNVVCFMGPFFHALGSVIAFLSCLHQGATLVSPEGSFSPAKSAEAIIQEKCTITIGTPTMYIDLLRVMDEKGLESKTVEVAVTGGAFAPVSLFNDMMRKLNLKRVSSVYGLTETGPIVFMSSVTDDQEKQFTTVGYIMDHMELKVSDEAGQPVPWNSPGELWIRGYNVMKGYWNEEKKTKEAITPEHWFRTGDQFTMSEDGYGKVVGRLKDMIIRGGENIYPAEVEDILSTHPDILEVQVVGVPDDRLGEELCACIRRKAGSQITKEAIQEFSKGKMAAFKIPRYVWFVDKFPRTSSGKVQKYKLRIMAREHLNLKELK